MLIYAGVLILVFCDNVLNISCFRFKTDSYRDIYLSRNETRHETKFDD